MQNDKVWTKNFLLIIIINFLVFMNHIMNLSTFPMFLEQVLGLNAAMAVVLRPVIGWMLDCGRRKSVLLAGLAGMLLMPLGYALSSSAAALATSVAPALGLAAISAPSSSAHNDV